MKKSIQDRLESMLFWHDRTIFCHSVTKHSRFLISNVLKSKRLSQKLHCVVCKKTVNNSDSGNAFISVKKLRMSSLQWCINHVSILYESWVMASKRYPTFSKGLHGTSNHLNCMRLVLIHGRPGMFKGLDASPGLRCWQTIHATFKIWCQVIYLGPKLPK